MTLDVVLQVRCSNLQGLVNAGDDYFHISFFRPTYAMSYSDNLTGTCGT